MKDYELLDTIRIYEEITIMKDEDFKITNMESKFSRKIKKYLKHVNSFEEESIKETI